MATYTSAEVAKLLKGMEEEIKELRAEELSRRVLYVRRTTDHK